MSSPSAGPIWLIGLPGAGKTSLGQLLAEYLARPFVDIDREIAARAGRSIPEIFAAEGEAAFRALETRLLEETAAAEPAPVAAVGAGAVEIEESRRVLGRGAVVLWLDLPWEEASERCLRDAAIRPLLADPAALRLRLPRRLRWYESLGRRVNARGSLPDVLRRALAELPD